MTIFQSHTPPITRDTLVTEPGGCFRSRCLRVSETHAADHPPSSIRRNPRVARLGGCRFRAEDSRQKGHFEAWRGRLVRVACGGGVGGCSAAEGSWQGKNAQLMRWGGPSPRSRSASNISMIARRCARTARAARGRSGPVSDRMVTSRAKESVMPSPFWSLRASIRSVYRAQVRASRAMPRAARAGSDLKSNDQRPGGSSKTRSFRRPRERTAWSRMMPARRRVGRWWWTSSGDLPIRSAISRADIGPQASRCSMMSARVGLQMAFHCAVVRMTAETSELLFCRMC